MHTQKEKQKAKRHVSALGQRASWKRKREAQALSVFSNSRAHTDPAPSNNIFHFALLYSRCPPLSLQSYCLPLPACPSFFIFAPLII
jgi:hypothetical protein